MKRLSGPIAVIKEQQAAIDKIEGLPRRPSFVGRAVRHLIPDKFIEGAPGWSEHAYTLTESDDKRAASLDIPDEKIASYDGQKVEVEGKEVTIDLSGAADKPVDPIEPPPKEPTDDGAPKSGSGGTTAPKK